MGEEGGLCEETHEGGRGHTMGQGGGEEGELQQGITEGCTIWLWNGPGRHDHMCVRGRNHKEHWNRLWAVPTAGSVGKRLRLI